MRGVRPHSANRSARRLATSKAMSDAPPKNNGKWGLCRQPGLAVGILELVKLTLMVERFKLGPIPAA